MWKPQIAATDGEGATGADAQAGLSFFLERHAGLDFVAHSGDQNGFISHLYVHVPSRTAYVASFNTDVAPSKVNLGRPSTRQVDAAVRDAIIREVIAR
jgi:hypothetical protein